MELGALAVIQNLYLFCTKHFAHPRKLFNFFCFRISDKSRFSYDGLKRQRLVAPMLRDNKCELKPVDWEAALLTVAKVIKNAGKIY